MKLYFLRHTTAADIASNDASRALTAVGQEEARRAGTGLAMLGATPSVILASPLLRARQTAEIAARAMGFAGAIGTLDELASESTTADLIRALKPHATSKEILLVGHMPSLAGHVATLIGVESAEEYSFGKGSVACVELDELRAGAGRLLWQKRLEQLREMKRQTRSL